MKIKLGSIFPVNRQMRRIVKTACPILVRECIVEAYGFLNKKGISTDMINKIIGKDAIENTAYANPATIDAYYPVKVKKALEEGILEAQNRLAEIKKTRKITTGSRKKMKKQN